MLDIIIVAYREFSYYAVKRGAVETDCNYGVANQQGESRLRV